MSNSKTKATPKKLSPAQEIAKSIVDGIKSKKIIMNAAQKISGKTKDGKAVSGMYFVSKPLPTKAIVEVRKEEVAGAKNASYSIKLTANKVTQTFSGAQARRAIKVLTSTPKQRVSKLSGENIKFCEEHLNFLGSADLA